MLARAQEDTAQAPDADSDGAPDADDCDDARADVNPAAQELCDGIDNDCDGAVDDADTQVDCPVHDVAADYSISDNPNGVWSVGWASSPNSALTLFTLAVTASPVFSVGYGSDPAVAVNGTPSAWKNDLAELYGAPAGHVWLHPGCGGQEYAVMRFTAPLDATCDVVIAHPYGDAGETDATVLLNGSELHYEAVTSTAPSWEDTLALRAGDTVDVAVGSLGACAFDSTSVVFTAACRVQTGR